MKEQKKVATINISWWSSFIKYATYARTSYFRALSLPVIPLLALMYNSSDKISVYFNYSVTKSRLVLRGGQNYFKTILERHLRYVLKLNIFLTLFIQNRRVSFDGGSWKDGRLRSSRYTRSLFYFPSRIEWSMIYGAVN